MATKRKKRTPARPAAQGAGELRPIESLLVGGPTEAVETRLTFRMWTDEYDPLRLLGKRYKHSPQSILELALNEFLTRRGIRPFRGVSGKLDRAEDPLRDWGPESNK